MKKTKYIKVCLLFFVVSLLSCSITFANFEEDAYFENRRVFIEEGVVMLGTEEPEILDNWLRLNGIYKCEALVGNDNSIKSAPGNAEFYGWGAYYDTFSGKYLIQTRWRWKNINYVDANAGAFELLSLSMHRTSDYGPVSGHIWRSNPWGIAVYDNDGVHFPNVGAGSGISQSAITYNFQDFWDGIFYYVGYRGQIWGWLDQRPSTLPFYLAGNYTHTWSSATLTSLSFDFSKGLSGLTPTWSITPQSWNLYDHLTVYNWPNLN